MSIVPDSVHLHLGGIVFPELDQADFTGPFEVLSRIPNSTFPSFSWHQTRNDLPAVAAVDFEISIGRHHDRVGRAEPGRRRINHGDQSRGRHYRRQRSLRD